MYPVLPMMQHTGLGLAVLALLLVTIGAWRLGVWFREREARQSRREWDAVFLPALARAEIIAAVRAQA